MSWNFVPRSPTAGAWKTRLFKHQYKLQQLMNEIRTTLPICQGQLVFCSDELPDCMKKTILKAENRFYVPYNHIRQLEEYMEYIKWNENKNLHKIVMYHTGYFIQ